MQIFMSSFILLNFKFIAKNFFFVFQIVFNVFQVKVFVSLKILVAVPL